MKPNLRTGSVFLLVACALLLNALTVHAQGPDDAAVVSQSAVKVRLFFPAARIPVAPAEPAFHWLAYINNFRAIAGVPALREDSEWSRGAQLHARYMVKNNVVTHGEDGGNPWYTPEGALAAARSNLIGGSNWAEANDRWAISSWMVAPFHAVGMLDPELTCTGFGSYAENKPGLVYAAGFDVIRGRGTQTPPSVHFPLLFPGPGSVVPLRYHWPETPNALTHCPGYTHPAGAPVIVQTGAGSGVPQVSASAFQRGSTALEHCVFTEATYYNPDGGHQNLGRTLLGSRDAVVLIPRQPLDPNTTYTVSLTIDGVVRRWSYTVGNIP